MSANSEYYSKALDMVIEKGQAAKERCEMKKIKIYLDCPELKAVDSEIGNVFFNALMKKYSNENIRYEDVEKTENELKSKRAELMKKIGVCDDDFKPKFDCAVCNDSGRANGKLCDCVKALAMKLIYDELNREIPLDKCTFDTFSLDYYSDNVSQNGVSPRKTMTKIFELCKKYAASFSSSSPSLIFYGETGLGKTHLSLAIANEAINKGFSVIYAPISRILGQIENEKFSSGLVGNETLSNVLSADLLIVDDLGTEFSTSFITSAIYDIINSRILSQKPTIINTNLNLEELEKRYTPRIVSRIIGNYTMFNFVGEDIRTLK